MARLPVVRGDQVARPSPGPQDAVGHAAHRFQPVRVGVEQDQLVDHHPVLVGAQAVHQLGRVRTPTPHHSHFGPHASNVTSAGDHRPEPQVTAGAVAGSPGEPAVLAVDGGASKTDVWLVAGDGTLLGTARGAGSNHQFFGLDGAMDNLGCDHRGRAGRRRARSVGPTGRPDRGVLPGRRGPPGRRGAGGRGRPLPGVELDRPGAQRHPGHPARRGPLRLGGGGGVRLRAELRGPRCGRRRRAVPVTGRAVGGLHPGRIVARRAGPRAGPAIPRRAGRAHRAHRAGPRPLRPGPARGGADRRLHRHHRVRPALRAGPGVPRGRRRR